MAKSISIKYFEVRSRDDAYGLEIRGNEAETLFGALDGINRLYRSALGRGYDNSRRKWAIVCTTTEKTVADNGDLIVEASTRKVVAKAEFSTLHGAFVFV